MQEVFPACCIHFEDWAGVDAIRLLDRYRDRVCCYNDDIQGTAGAALAGLFSALRVKGGKLEDERVMFLGAGSAGTGIAGMIVKAMMLEGLSEPSAQARIAMFDVNGLIEASRKDLLDFQKPYAHDLAPTKDFVAAIEAFKPTAIIGVSTSAKAFDQRGRLDHGQAQRASHHLRAVEPDRPCRVHRRGSLQVVRRPRPVRSRRPFPPFDYAGRMIVPGQGNNLYVFPAVALAVYATRAARVPDDLFIAAARGVADLVTPAQLELGTALSAAEQHSGDRATGRGPRGRGDLQARSRARAEAEGYRRLHFLPHVRAGIPDVGVTL